MMISGRSYWLAAICLYLAVAPLDGAEPHDPIAGRAHWAFRPLSTMRPSTSEWSDTSIDNFVKATLDAQGLRPNPIAEPQDLLRRLTFQLTGLPPTPSEIDRFLADTRPDAWERLVDRLLDSPRFGERWGRHWLDLARYADSNGLDENFLFREAWRYRNWVIEAINADQPFDRFVLEQIAGDLLPYDSIAQRDRQRIGAGFMVMGPKVLLGNNPKNQRMEVADEQIDTIGRAFLGLTLGCARCHDHKFEPVPTADYYALAGILTSTTVMERRHMLGQQRVMEQLVGLGSEGDQLDNAYEKYWREAKNKKQTISRANEALKLLEKDDEAGLVALLDKHNSVLTDTAKDHTLSKEERVQAQKAHIDQLVKAAIPPPIPPRAMIPADADTPADEAIRISGKFDKLGDKVPRGYLQVISSASKAEIPEGASGRVQLGEWLTDTEDGAGILTARVLANRVWYHLIGRGLVRTVDNFGRTGEAPSHPELLDYLASEFIRSNWSIKALVRRIVVSRAFRLSSMHQPQAHEIDPENRLLWRAHRRRLDPESLRDAILFAANQLDFGWTDSTVNYLGDQATAVGKNENRRRTDFPCRSVYLPMIRNDLPELFEAFDFADPHATTGARPETSDPTQGLFLLNDEMVIKAAEAFAARLLEQDETTTRMVTLFQRAIGSEPTDEEITSVSNFVRITEERLTKEGAERPQHRAWTMACHAVFSLSRFQFLE